jgi:hypothetical protein
MQDLLSRLLIVYFSLFILSCQNNKGYIFENSKLKVELPSISTFCIKECENAFSDYSGNDWCYVDTCNDYSIFIVAHRDTSLLDLIINSEYKRLNDSFVHSLITVERELTNDFLLRKNITYEENVEPYTYSTEEERTNKTSYITFGTNGINRKGAFSVKIRKEIEESNIKKDLMWIEQFRNIKVEIKDPQ